jgi:hypothetical protein
LPQCHPYNPHRQHPSNPDAQSWLTFFIPHHINIFKFIGFLTPIKHISCKNQCIFRVGLANHLILLIAKFSDADEARKTWCGKYLIKANKSTDLYDNYVN